MPDALGNAREGYELWRPNREKAGSKTTKFLVGLVLLISAALILIITIGGLDRLQGGAVILISIIYAALYILFAILVVARWQRGVLPVASALAIILLIFALIAAPAWFARDKEGLTSPALPEELLGLLTLVLVPVQLALIAIAMIAFNQNWHVEEERPIGGERPDEGPPPADDRAQPAPA